MLSSPFSVDSLGDRGERALYTMTLRLLKIITSSFGSRQWSNNNGYTIESGRSVTTYRKLNFGVVRGAYLNFSFKSLKSTSRSPLNWWLWWKQRSRFCILLYYCVCGSTQSINFNHINFVLYFRLPLPKSKKVSQQVFQTTKTLYNKSRFLKQQIRLTIKW